MKFFIKIINKICLIINNCIRNNKVANWRKENKIEHISIIASNCIGGLLLHDLGLRFESPTVNLSFPGEDFVKFCENLEYYLSKDFSEFFIEPKYGFLTGKLDDINIYFVHYKTKEEAIEKWNERKKRIDFENMFFIHSFQEGMNLSLLKRYLRLPYKKIIYVHKKELILSDECIMIPGLEKYDQLPDISPYYKVTGYKYYDKFFNLVKWINNK